MHVNTEEKNGCGTRFLMDFKTNSAVTFKVLSGTQKDQYLCYSYTENYVTHCSTAYDFQYTFVNKTEYGGNGIYHFGWNDKSLGWGNESANDYCSDFAHKFISITKSSLENGELFYAIFDRQVDQKFRKSSEPEHCYV